MKQAVMNAVALLGLAGIAAGVWGIAGVWVALIVAGFFLFAGALVASQGGND